MESIAYVDYKVNLGVTMLPARTRINLKQVPKMSTRMRKGCCSSSLLCRVVVPGTIQT